MIYLIGGPPRCGKTTLARRLARVTGAPLLTIDHLEGAVYHYLPPGERARAMPRFAEATNNDRYAAHSVDEIVAMLRTCAWSMWPAAHILMHCALEGDRDLILDGYHLEPRFLAELTPPAAPPEESLGKLSSYQAAMVDGGSGYALAHAGDPRLRAIFLYREDVAAIVAGLTRADDPNDWIACQDNTPETLQGIATMICSYSRLIREEAEAYGATAFNMDQDFCGQLTRALAYLS